MIVIRSSEITPERLYRSRRRFLREAGILAAGGLLAGACRSETPVPTAAPTPASTATQVSSQDRQEDDSNPSTSSSADELGDPLTPFDQVTGFTNFYEFTTNKRAVADLAEDFVTSPWTISVGGLVGSPKTYDLDDLHARFPSEERIYRMRCVEAWSMVIPWLGFPLADLLRDVDPLPEAQYARFETFADPEQMPGLEGSSFPWPYVEGLRIDEAMHDLTILATGLYGVDLPPQNGAPVRLVVPWKYGFKSIKSIVKVELLAEEPSTFWSTANPREYGFYANVNPAYPHPRWSQERELRIGEDERRETLLFNGYADQVADLYAGMEENIYY